VPPTASPSTGLAVPTQTCLNLIEHHAIRFFSGPDLHGCCMERIRAAATHGGLCFQLCWLGAVRVSRAFKYRRMFPSIWCRRLSILPGVKLRCRVLTDRKQSGFGQSCLPEARFSFSTAAWASSQSPKRRPTLNQLPMLVKSRSA